eukprot:6185281-Pleurochrysis_carterae.AAC.1
MSPPYQKWGRHRRLNCSTGCLCVMVPLPGWLGSCRPSGRVHVATKLTLLKRVDGRCLPATMPRCAALTWSRPLVISTVISSAVSVQPQGLMGNLSGRDSDVSHRASCASL